MRTIPIETLRSFGLQDRFLRAEFVDLPIKYQKMFRRWRKSTSAIASWFFFEGDSEELLQLAHVVLKTALVQDKSVLLVEPRTLVDAYMHDMASFIDYRETDVAIVELTQDSYNRMESKVVEEFLDGRYRRCRQSIVLSRIPLRGPTDSFENNFGPEITRKLENAIGGGK